MFKKWLEHNKISKETFQSRIFPKASNREFWDRSTNRELISNAEKYIGYEWPLIRASQYMEFQKSGDRLAQETPHFDRRSALAALFLGELAENKCRFLPDLCDGIFLICEESFWGLSAHIQAEGRYFLPDTANHYIDLFAAETAELLAIIYHILYDEIKEYCPELTERLEYELDQRIVKPYLKNTHYWWMGNQGNHINNWNPWIISNILTVFLTIDLDRDLFESGLEKMFREINNYYDAVPDDGGCDEGCNYWINAGAKLFSFCDLLYITSNGRVNFFDDEKLRNIGRYEVKAYIGDCYFVNFADGNARMKGTNLFYALYGFGLRTKDDSFCKLAGSLKRKQNRDIKPAVRGSNIKSVLFSLIYADEINAQPDFEPDEMNILPNLQNSFMRSGDWYYAAKGGHNAENHNHNDVGNVLVFNGTEPVLVDAGCGVYTKLTFSPRRYEIWTMQSGWHNLPVLNGFEQVNGRNYRADSFEVDGKTTTVSFAEAYPREAEISRAVRQVSITDSGVTIRDDLVFEAEFNKVEEHFVTVQKPEITEQGAVIGDRYLLKTSLPAKVEWMDFKGDSKLKSNWGTEGLYRICLYSECKKSITVKIEIRSLKK